MLSVRICRYKTGAIGKIFSDGLYSAFESTAFALIGRRMYDYRLLAYQIKNICILLSASVIYNQYGQFLFIKFFYKLYQFSVRFVSRNQYNIPHIFSFNLTLRHFYCKID